MPGPTPSQPSAPPSSSSPLPGTLASLVASALALAALVALVASILAFGVECWIGGTPYLAKDGDYTVTSHSFIHHVSEFDYRLARYVRPSVVGLLLVSGGVLAILDGLLERRIRRARPRRFTFDRWSPRIILGAILIAAALTVAGWFRPSRGEFFGPRPDRIGERPASSP